MTDNRKKTDTAETKTGATKPALISRRSLLKQGAVAMPAVLTLQSGAALAASSAYIGSVSLEASRIAGHVHCLDVRNAEPLPNGTTFRFVDTDYADVYVIPDGQYYPSQGQKESYVRADRYCSTGGTKFMKADGYAGFPEVKLPENMNGILVSSTALNSITAAFGNGVEKKTLLP